MRSFIQTADFAVLRRQSKKHLTNGEQTKLTLSIKNRKQAHEMTAGKT